MSTAANYVAMTVSGAPGTGTITLLAASSGYRSFATAYGADAVVDVLITDGAAWEVARNCAYTHSGTTLTRGTLENSSTGSALSLTSAATVEVVLPASAINRYESAGLTTAAASVTTADVTGVVGTLHYLDLSGLTAARNFTLPAVAAVDDRVGVYVSAGCTTAGRELIIKANTGDTLNGVSAAEWSRVFITGEVVIMRCVVANTTWVVDYDGRIPCMGALTRTTLQSMPNGGFNKINCATSEISVGSIVNTGSSRIDIRRAGNYLVGGFIRLDLNSGKSLVTGLGKNATVVARGQSMSAASPGTVGVSALSPLTLAVADQVELYVYHDNGLNADTATVADSVPRIYVTEVV
jgi:hypothetical protein